MFTNTQDAGECLESYGVVVWSQCASFFGLFSSEFAQRGIQREDRSGRSVAYPVQDGTAQKFS